MSAFSTGNELNDQKVYRKFARTIPDHIDLSQAIFSYLNHKYDILNNQPYVAILVPTTRGGIQFASELTEYLAKRGIPHNQIQAISIDRTGEGAAERIRTLEELRFRYIIVLGMDFTREGFDTLMEEAINLDLIGNEKNTWMFSQHLIDMDDDGHYPLGSPIISALEVRIVFNYFIAVDIEC